MLVFSLGEGSTMVHWFWRRSLFLPFKKGVALRLNKQTVIFVFFISSPKITFMENKHYERVIGILFRLERNKYCSTYTI